MFYALWWYSCVVKEVHSTYYIVLYSIKQRLYYQDPSIGLCREPDEFILSLYKVLISHISIFRAYICHLSLTFNAPDQNWYKLVMSHAYSSFIMKSVLRHVRIHIHSESSTECDRKMPFSSSIVLYFFKSSSSCLGLLPSLLVSFIIPSKSRIRKQLLRTMLPIQLAFLFYCS